MEFETLENLVREKQIEIESCKKEIEMQRIEKEQLEKRVSEVIHFRINLILKVYLFVQFCNVCYFGVVT